VWLPSPRPLFARLRSRHRNRAAKIASLFGCIPRLFTFRPSGSSMPRALCSGDLGARLPSSFPPVFCGAVILLLFLLRRTLQQERPDLWLETPSADWKKRARQSRCYAFFRFRWASRAPSLAFEVRRFFLGESLSGVLTGCSRLSPRSEERPCLDLTRSRLVPSLGPVPQTIGIRSWGCWAHSTSLSSVPLSLRSPGVVRALATNVPRFLFLLVGTGWASAR